MEWLQGNWLWILFLIAMFAMHMFGHGGHSHDGGHGRRQPDDDDARPGSSSERRSTAHPGEPASAASQVRTPEVE